MKPNLTVSEMRKILNELAIDFMGEKQLVGNEWMVAEAERQINELIREARIDEVQSAYDLIQGLLLEYEDSDEVTGQFQILARDRLRELARLKQTEVKDE